MTSSFFKKFLLLRTQEHGIVFARTLTHPTQLWIFKPLFPKFFWDRGFADLRHHGRIIQLSGSFWRSSGSVLLGRIQKFFILHQLSFPSSFFGPLMYHRYYILAIYLVPKFCSCCMLRQSFWERLHCTHSMCFYYKISIHFQEYYRVLKILENRF